MLFQWEQRASLFLSPTLTDEEPGILGNRTNNAGSYLINLDVGKDSGYNKNYNIQTETGTLTLDKATLTVEPGSPTVETGKHVDLTGKVTGLTNGDTPESTGITYTSNGVTNGTAGAPGKYTVTGELTNLDGNNNYKVTVIPGELNVTRPTPEPTPTPEPEPTPTPEPTPDPTPNRPGGGDDPQNLDDNYDYLRPGALATQNLAGTGSIANQTGAQGVPGVDRVAGLADAQLPFFRVARGQVTNYGTYDVAAEPDSVKLTPTAKRLPEPQGEENQYHEYTTDLAGAEGAEGSFRITYNGVALNITPENNAAVSILRAGDPKNNVEVASEALHTAFSDLGLVLEDLDGVYIHMDR